MTDINATWVAIESFLMSVGASDRLYDKKLDGHWILRIIDSFRKYCPTCNDELLARTCDLLGLLEQDYCGGNSWGRRESNVALKLGGFQPLKEGPIEISVHVLELMGQDDTPNDPKGRL